MAGETSKKQTHYVWANKKTTGVVCFRSYNAIKNWIQADDADQPLGAKLHMLTAAEAGVLTLLVTNPIWVVKTRLCLQYESDLKVTGTKHTYYKGMVDALVKIYQEEGVRGYYRVNKT